MYMKQMQKNAFFYTLALLGQGLIYKFTGVFNSTFQSSREMSFSVFIDGMIPFIPQGIWPYCLYYIILFSGILLSLDEKVFPRFLKTFIILSLMADLCFVILPVSTPLQTYALLTGSEYTQKLLSFILAIDTRSNCFPSLHCAHSFLITFWFYQSDVLPKYLRPVLLLMTCMVVLSTLLIKQHWFADIIGAFFLFFCILRINGKQLQNQSV